MPNKSGQSAPDPDNAVPLCVDLDGTLVRTDVLIESIFALLKRNILFLFLLPVWVLRGKARFKHEIADRVDMDVSLLPYCSSLLTYLRELKSAGRPIVLATASNQKFANQIAQHLGLFDVVLASDAELNLSGNRKRERLIEVFGEHGFDYAGNAGIDLRIWSHSRKGILVNTSSSLKRQARQVCEVERVFDDRDNGIRPYIKAIRLHQWLKNLLVFVPLMVAHQIQEVDLLLQASLAFLAFGLCASSVYLLNDLLDLPEDRRHPTKRARPLATGQVPIQAAMLLIPGLLILAFAVALLLPIEFVAVLGLYYIATLAYSLGLKRVAIVDVLLLAGLYTIRIIGGSMVSIVPSFWLLAFSIFIFLSLALVKRYSELLVLRKVNEEVARGRGYMMVDLEGLAQFGTASGYMSVLVLALYINSDQVGKLYTHPELIWLLCPLFLYWISRIWLLARRDLMHEDPVVFAIQDRASYWVGLLGFIVLFAAL